jgi:hypothetical protein
VRAATFLQRLFIGWNRSKGSDWFANLGTPSAVGAAIDQYAEAALGNREFFLEQAVWDRRWNERQHSPTVSQPVHMIKMEREIAAYRSDRER